jgi:prolyl oligopeptidase
LQQPKTRKDEIVETLHGIQVPDPYRWLEKSDEPEVQAWLTEQANYAESYFSRIPFRAQLRDELKRLFSLDTVGLPVPRRGRYFFTARKGDQDMAVLYVQDGLDGTPRPLVNPNTLSQDKTITLRQWSPSPDGRLLAYCLSKAGNDQADIRVMDVDAGKDLPDYIPDDVYPAVYSPITWNGDGSGFWYTKRAPEVSASEGKFFQRVYFHALGTDWKHDPLVFGRELGKEDVPMIELSDDGRYLLTTVFGFSDRQESVTLFLKDRKSASQGFIPIVPRIPGIKFYGQLHRNKIYILTNHEAPRWQLMVIGINEALAGKTPTTLIPEGQDTLQWHILVGEYLFTLSLENVHSMLRQYRLDGSYVREIPLPTIGAINGVSYEPEGTELFFEFVSFAVPPTVYRVDLVSGKISVFKKMEAGFDIDAITTEHVWYRSKDGTAIPMFLIYKKGLTRNGANPTVLYGYGGFEVSLTPSFMKSIVPFVMRGGIFAIANLRGGGEFGKAWHEAGMRKLKQNVFDDFAAAAEWLIASGYTCRNRLAIYGGSNGGLLVTATITQQPNLVKAAIAKVPVTDMLRFHLFFGGRHWVPEYGDPDDPDMFPYLLGYSPYHNVHDGVRYPATLIMTADSDDRVHPMHSYKMVARLQEANASDNPILLRVERKAGHGGASAISKLIEEQADFWSFVFDQLNVNI